MDNKDLPAFPIVMYPGSPDQESWPGISKREYFAAMAMQGILAGNKLEDIVHSDMFKSIASDSVSAADALLAELSKP